MPIKDINTTSFFSKKVALFCADSPRRELASWRWS